MATKNDVATEATPPPWDLALYTSAYALGPVGPDDAQRHASDAWGRLLVHRPLLYLPDRTPHGEYDPRLHHGRRLWRHDELLAFDAVVEQRTQVLWQQQHLTLQHWRQSAIVVQAHVRGLLARRRVERMRLQLYEAAMAALRARELAALRKCQFHAAIRIQTVYHRHCARLHYVFACRQRILRFVRLYVFRWQRHRAARVLQRAFRQFRRRVCLQLALCSLLRMFRLSRQRAALEEAVAAFHNSRRDIRERQRQRQWTLFPTEMATATRVCKRKAKLQSLPPLVARPSPPGNQSPSSTTQHLPRL